MRSAILFLAVCQLSCGQPSPIDKQAKDTIPSDNIVDDFAAGKASLQNDFLLNKDSAEYSSQDLQTAILIGYLFEKETIVR